ncbi:hypothetical protein ACHAPU_003187 [Fusarium lateritium]
MSTPSKTGEGKSGDDQVMLTQDKLKLNYSPAHTFEFVPNAIDQVQVLDDSDDDKDSEWTDAALEQPKKKVPAATNVEVANTEALRQELDDAMKGDDSVNISEVQKWINGVDSTSPNSFDIDNDDEALSQAMILGTVQKDGTFTADSSTKGGSPDTAKDRARKRIAGALKFLEPEMKSDKKN